jgi:hypothetical protein
MFFKNKSDEKVKQANEKMVRKVLGKSSGRRVFGFKCSPNIQASMKSFADQIHVPLFALVEHVLQLGSMQIKAAMNDPEEREELRRHLTEVHVEMRTIEKVARFDEEAADTLSRERIWRFDIDRATRQLVVKFTGRGIKPQDLEEMILFAYRCTQAIAGGWPCPPEISPRGYPDRPQNLNKKHNPDESESDSPDKPN